jgi:predicted RNA-binding Zn ribbon-like protein
METHGHFKQVRLVGGNLALDFVNTETGPHDGPPDGDALESYEDLLSWSRQVGAIGNPQLNALALAAREAPTAAASALREAARLRSQLWELFAALARKQEPDNGLLGLLRDDAARSLGYAKLARTGESYAWDWSDCTSLNASLWPLVQAAIDLVQSRSLKDVKQCAACRFLFVDTSKNGSRRWCSMEDCGKTAKMRRYVARRQASRMPARPE